MAYELPMARRLARLAYERSLGVQAFGARPGTRDQEHARACRHLRDGIALPSNGIGGTGAAAIRHDLDEAGALAQLLPAGAAHFIDAVGDAAERAEIAHPPGRVVGVVARPVVGMATR